MVLEERNGRSAAQPSFPQPWGQGGGDDLTGWDPGPGASQLGRMQFDVGAWAGGLARFGSCGVGVDPRLRGAP